MKNLLLIILFLFITHYGFSQSIYFYEDFEGTSPNCTTQNVDGQTDDPSIYTNLGLDFSGGWIIWSTTTPNNNFAASNSYFSPVGMADRWLFTSAISVSTASAILSWKAKSYNASFLESYNVYVTTSISGTTPDYTDFIGSPVFTTTSEQAASLMNHSVNLSNSPGATIYIAFQHSSYDETILEIDDIKVEASPPSNDNCSGAITLTQSTSCNTTNGTTVGATQSLSALTCNTYTASTANDVWYRFVATSANPTITVVGSSSFDAIIDLRSGSCNGTNIDCADATTGGGIETINATGLTIGSTYYIRVYDFSGSFGAFTICVFGAPPASISNVNPNTGTAGQTLNVTITGLNTHFTQGSSTYVDFSFNQGSSTVVNSINITNDISLIANVTIPSITPAGYYNVIVNNSIDGNLVLNNGFSVTVPSPPSNDNCSGAITLTQSTSCNTTNGTTVGATQSLSALTCNTYTASTANDVWYRFVATSANPTITVVGSSSFDAIIDLRSGSCNGTNIDCADATTGGGIETINATGLTIGSTYYIRVYDFSGSFGAFTICVFGAPPASISNVNPNTGTAGQTLNVTITGLNTHFTQGSSTYVDFSFNQGSSTVVNSINITNDISLIANVTIPSITPAGYYNVIVNNSIDGNLVLNNGFYVNVPSKINDIFSENYFKSFNYPNPFNNNTIIYYTLPQSGIVTIKVYSLYGQLITTLTNERMNNGEHGINFDGSSFGSGIYIYKIQSGSHISTHKLHIVK